jgi:hypothetical protein
VYDAAVSGRPTILILPGRRSRGLQPIKETAKAVTSKPPTDAGHPSEDQETEVSDPHSLWAELGLSEPDYLDESLAPKVDEPLLRSLIRQELPEKVARAVYRLICSFASWHHAHTKLLLEELKRSREPTNP